MKLFFIAFEGESYLIGQIARRFKVAGHSVFIFNSDHYTVTQGDGGEYKYYQKLGLTTTEFTNLEDVYAELNSDSKAEIDFEFLRQFEEQYCANRTLHDVLTTDPTLSSIYHHRNIYHWPADKNIYYRFLELSTKKIHRAFIVDRPDVVFTRDIQYFFKGLLYEVAKSLNIPFYSLCSSRFEDVFVIFDNFCLGTPQDIQHEMIRLESVADPCPDASRYIEQIRTGAKHPYDSFAVTMRGIASNLSSISKIKSLYRTIRYLIRPRFAVWKRYRSFPKRDYFLPSLRDLITTTFIGALRSLAYQRDRSLNQTKLPTKPVLYFAMHLIPESSTLTLSHTHNEMESIFQLSKLLPLPWVLAVKINPNMIADYDTHPNEYYRRINSLPNVIFVHPMIPSSEIIRKASAVASLTGTVLLEGVIHNIPAFRFGNPEFAVVTGIFEFDRTLFRDQLSREVVTNVKYYIQSCFNLGIRIDSNLLEHSGETNIRSAEYQRQVSLIYDQLRFRLGGILRTDKTNL